MRLLLDTQVFLWWWGGSRRLKGDALAAIKDGENEVYLSAVVAWEIVIKRSLGRLDFDGEVDRVAAEEGFERLPVELRHADEVASLPVHHRDPFDRMLIAQARVESLVLVSNDRAMERYGGFVLLRA